MLIPRPCSHLWHVWVLEAGPKFGEEPRAAVHPETNPETLRRPAIANRTRQSTVTEEPTLGRPTATYVGSRSAPINTGTGALALPLPHPLQIRCCL